jgi:hypothetical protein
VAAVGSVAIDTIPPDKLKKVNTMRISNLVLINRGKSPVPRSTSNRGSLFSLKGEGAIACVGMSNPSIHHNNFVENEVAIQTRSTIYIEARNNWWGSVLPDTDYIFSDPDRNNNIKP